MNLAKVLPGDIVRVNKRGREFYAIVVGKEKHELSIEPLDKRVNYYTATAREAVALWRKERPRIKQPKQE